jgi:hypothetical protein
MSESNARMESSRDGLFSEGNPGARGEGAWRGCAARPLKLWSLAGEDELDERREAPADFD